MLPARFRFALLALVSAALLGCGAEPPPAQTLVGPQRVEVWLPPVRESAAQPDLSVAPDGRLLLSWISKPPGRRPALQIAEYSPDGRWDQPRTVAVGNSLFVNWADTPHVVATADRAIWVHWLQKSADAPYAYDIKLVRSLDHGMNWSAPRTVHDDATTTEHGFVAFWPQSENSIGAVWLDGRNTASTGAGGHDGHDTQSAHESHDTFGDAMTLRGAVFDARLTPSMQAELDARTCDCCQTAAAATGNGALVVYRDRSEKEIRDIYAVRFDGNAWSPPVRVHADDWTMPGCPVNGPSVAARGQRAVVAWYTGANDTPTVKLALSTDGGAQFADPVVVDEGPAVLGRVAVAMDASQVWLLWMREEAGRQSLWLARYAPDLGKRFTKIELAKIEGNGRATGFPKIALRDDAAYVVWTDADATGPNLRGLRLSAATAAETAKALQATR